MGVHTRLHSALVLGVGQSRSQLLRVSTLRRQSRFQVRQNTGSEGQGQGLERASVSLI